MVHSLLKDDSVRMRCAVSGNGDYYSDPFTVTVTDVEQQLTASVFRAGRTPVAPDPLPAPVGVPNKTMPKTPEDTLPAATEETVAAAIQETNPAVTEESEDEEETASETSEENTPTVTEEAESEDEEETVSETSEENTPIVTEEVESENEEESEPEDTQKAASYLTEKTVVIEEEAVPLAASFSAQIVLLSSAVPAAQSVEHALPEEDAEIYTVTIEYLYGDNSKFSGQRVALPYIAEVSAGEILDATVSSPNCVGYAPEITSINLADQGQITSNVNLTVKYSPAEVSYTVRHYQQNVDNDEYSWVDTTMATGYTEALTSDAAAKTYTGFTALSHYHEEIAADSSTLIDIYYDRNYYLMSFDLKGGYGVEAVYARYGANITIANPQRAGYSFKAWTLNGTTETILPGTMPARNSSYTALWTVGNASYTIAYWLENPDIENRYDYAGSATAIASSGNLVSGSDSAVANGVFTATESQYYSYNTSMTDTNIPIAGDGSSVVNVYYDRNEYTLKFYYARSYVTGGQTYYQVATSTGGSSAQYGQVADASWNGMYTIKPALDSIYDEQSETISGYTYYWFTLTKKYGANLADIWPNAPLAKTSDVKFVSWGTQYGSGYHTANTNKNIKGIYSIMDEGLLKNATTTADKGINHWMVGYWGNPTMYTYEIYFSLLAGEVPDYTYQNNSYKKITQYTVGSTAYPSEGQTALSFEGVVNTGMHYDVDTKVDGTIIRFFYRRNVHTLTLDNNYGTQTSYQVPYGGTLSSYIPEMAKPTYPPELPGGAYEFGGWYQSKDGIGQLDTETTMPNKDLVYYAKWIPKNYTVTINDGNGVKLSTEQVSYGAKANKPNDPTMENATFVGWYYKDAQNAEQRFDFDNMTIIQDMTIYAKWRSNLMKQVEIHYVVEDDNGNQIPIANTETLMLHLGQTRTFEAKTGSTLYTQYRSHCFPVIASHSITITDADIENPDPVSYTFVYKQYKAIPYQIRYFVEKDGYKWPAFRQVTQNGSKAIEFVKAGDWQVSDQEYIEMHWDNDKAVVTELYIPDALRETHWTLPNNYLPNALRIKQIIIPSGENPEENIEANTIEFVYTYTEPKEDPDNPDTPVYAARYLVQHYVQSTSGEDAYNLYSYSDESGFSGETATASPISIPGYTFSAEQTNSKKKADTTLNADQTMSGKIVANNSLELNFYYTVNTYPYQVMYLEEGTNRILAAAKTTATDGSQLMGQYGSPVTETAITIEGYDIIGADSKTIEIQMEVGSEASVNTIVFYYKRKSAELILSKSVKLDETQAAQVGIAEIPSWVYDQEFEFTVYQPEGYPKSIYHYTFTDANGNSEERTVNAGVQTITVKLKHGEKIRFHDFPMGTYTVTETYVPGFRTSVDDFIAQSHTVTLETDDQTGKLDFVNTFPFYTGDLVLHKRVTKLHDTDPTATKPYTVTVVLKPHDSAREIDRVITWTNAGAEEPSTFTVPALSETNQQKEFTISVLVPVDSEVKLEGVPVGDFSATEETQGTLGYIYDYYTVKYNKAVHQNDEVTGRNHIVQGSIHGGHPTAVTFHNTYKKGTLTIHKTVNQEYENDLWQSDSFTFHITGTTELPDGEYWVEGATVTVTNGTVTVTDASGKDPTISITRTDDSASWSSSLTFENLPAGYYTVTETAGLGNDQYSSVCPQNNLLVNNVLQETEANFINTYKRHLRDLTITTVCSDKTQSFLFDVSANDTEMGDVHQTVVLVGSDSQTIRDLPVGEYTVTEQTQWSWRETDVASQTVALQEENKTVSFDFGNIDRIYWLNGYSYHRKGGS